MRDGDEGIPELTEAERIRIRATESDFTAMGDALRNGTATPEDVEGAFARLMSLAENPVLGQNPVPFLRRIARIHTRAAAGPGVARRRCAGS